MGGWIQHHFDVRKILNNQGQGAGGPPICRQRSVSISLIRVAMNGKSPVAQNPSRKYLMNDPMK